MTGIGLFKQLTSQEFSTTTLSLHPSQPS